MTLLNAELCGNSQGTRPDAARSPPALRDVIVLARQFQSKQQQAAAKAARVDATTTAGAAAASASFPSAPPLSTRIISVDGVQVSTRVRPDKVRLRAQAIETVDHTAELRARLQALGV